MTIKTARSILLLAAAVAVSAGCGSRNEVANALAATALVRDAEGRDVGRLSLTETSTGVRVQGTLQALPAGRHGFHVHAVGTCEAPFTTAGGHFNPSGRKHGTSNPEGPHAGDLPNIDVAGDGTVRINLIGSGMTLATGATALLDTDGAALVVHATQDDGVTDPAGNAGARIACGVVQR